MDVTKIDLDKVTYVPDNVFFNDRWQNPPSDRSFGQPKVISAWKIIRAWIGLNDLSDVVESTKNWKMHIQIIYFYIMLLLFLSTPWALCKKDVFIYTS